MSDGWSRMMSAASGTTTRSATTATVADAHRHPAVVTMVARTGRKISCPVALADVMMPVTRPRRRTNQRLPTIAASGIETAPVAVPMTRPQSRRSCHGAEMSVVAAEAAATTRSAVTVTRRTPKRSCRAAANGAPSPNMIRLIDTAEETVAALQPNSCSSGTMRTPAVERNPALITSTRRVTPAMAHP